MHADVPVDWAPWGFMKKIMGDLGFVLFGRNSLLSLFWLKPFEDLPPGQRHIANLLLG